jgi:predicted nucleic acid-binding protein
MAQVSAIADNTVLTNFALIQREDILLKVFEGHLFISEAVSEELQRGEEKGILPRREWKWIQILSLNSSQEMSLFHLLRQQLGTGESSCLSLAIHRNLKVLTDDLEARKYAQTRGIPVSGTIGVLVAAVKKGVISLEEGNRLLAEMIEHGYYSPYETLNGLL